MTTWTERYAGAIMDTFGPPQRVLTRGEGCYVYDDDGARYLDLLAGIAVNALGHAHPDWVAAVSQQAGTLAHVSNFFATHPQVELAETLLRLTGAPAGSRVFFTNSGTEALEAAFKMARRVPTSPPGGQGAPGRILALEGAFHGRTLGALALTHRPTYREPFEPLPAGVEHIAVTLDALEAAFSQEAVASRGPVVAVFVEPIQGEAGVRPLPEGFLRRARQLSVAAGALLVVDEVQTGIRRTGTWFGYQNPALVCDQDDPGDQDAHGPILPDVVTLAKGLGGGFPIGAVVALGERAATLLGRGQHGTTYGGNPLAARAALTVLQVIERDNLPTRLDGPSGDSVGDWLRARLDSRGSSPLVTGVRGEGMLLGIELAAPVAADVARLALDEGLIVNAVAPDTIRLAPPLILSLEQAAVAADFFDSLRLADDGTVLCEPGISSTSAATPSAQADADYLRDAHAADGHPRSGNLPSAHSAASALSTPSASGSVRPDQPSPSDLEEPA